jgi:hypothetical protein
MRYTYCNCEKCRQSQEPHFYRLDVLRQFVEDRENHIQYQKSYRMVDVLGLMDDVIARSQPAKAAQAELVPGGQRSSEHPSAPSLRQMLIDHFNDSELNDLCFDLGIEYTDLPGEGRADKARELVAHVQRRGRTAELVALCRQFRPDANW